MSAAQPIDAERVEWIGVDWGTTNLRAWAMAADTAIATTYAPVGMASLRRDQFEPALLGCVEAWLRAGRVTPVVACGMVGARQGWQEVPYVPVPTVPTVGSAIRRIAAHDPRIAVTVLHGLSQSSPPDVMRGEETQIAGLLATDPQFEGAVCLPGTHSKWANLRAGRVQSFRTFMTGELFSLLSSQSVLRHSIAEEDDFSHQAFEAAVRESLEYPAGLTSRLFSIRAAGLVGQPNPGAAYARLSGLLIGHEIAATREMWRDDTVVLIGEPALCARYMTALELAGGKPVARSVEDCTLAGLIAARGLIQTEPLP